MIRKALSILFIFVFMMATTHITELWKLPQFVKHYIAHKSLDEKMGFWQFVSMHYMQDTSSHADHKEDSKLPFKTLISNAAAIVLFVPCSIFHTLAHPVASTAGAAQARYIASCPVSFSLPVWQPPKFI